MVKCCIENCKSGTNSENIKCDKEGVRKKTLFKVPKVSEIINLVTKVK